MGKILIIKGADFSAVAIDNKVNLLEEILLTNWKVGIYLGNETTGVTSDFKENYRTDRIATVENPPIEVSKYNTIKIDFSKYNYAIFYRDASQQIITGTRYAVESSNPNFKTVFPMPSNAVYVDVALRPL